MDIVAIHRSGEGAARLEVDSWGHGWGYNFKFGCAGTPMRNLWFQDADAIEIGDEFDRLETARPDMPSREVWLTVIDPYLD